MSILSGYRVLDLSWGTAGPIATMILADHGADVIKVEPPGGDPFRTLDAYRVWNRGSRSLVLDLKDETDRASFERLLGTAQVIVESFSPGTMTRLGLGWDYVHEQFPGIVYCSLSAYGENNEDANRPGYEALIQARLGVLNQQAGPRPGPKLPGWPGSAYGTAYLAVTGIAAALLVRAKTGQGQRVQVSMLDGFLGMSAMNLTWGEHLLSQEVGTHTTPTGERMRFLSGFYCCADGKWIQIHTVGFGALNRQLECLGLNDLIQPPGANEYTMVFTAEESARLEDIPAIFATRPRQEWMDLFTEADVPHAPVVELGETLLGEQVEAIGMRTLVNDPDLGDLTQVGVPVRFSATPGQVGGAAPGIGVHTEAILQELDSSSAQERVSAGKVKETTTAIPSSAPLDGVKVLDFGMWMAGPGNSRVLADLGADVIKVEVYGGDGMRGFTHPWLAGNRGKRGIVLNLKEPAALEIAQELISQADVVTHNWRPGVAERLSMDYHTVRQIKNDVIYAWSAGFGTTGPWVKLPAMEPLVSIRSGMYRYYHPYPDSPPVPTAGGNMDWGNSVMAAGSIILALLHRDQTGEGQQIVSPQLSAALFSVAEVFVTSDGTRRGPFSVDQSQSHFLTDPLSGLYETADGWICVVCANDEHWKALCDVAGVSTDLRSSDRATRAEQAELLRTTLSDAFKLNKTSELYDRLDSSGVPCEIPATDVGARILQDDRYLASKQVVHYTHPRWGQMHEVGELIHLSNSPGRIRGPAPEYGQHTLEVLAELGISEQKARELRAAGVVDWSDIGND